MNMTVKAQLADLPFLLELLKAFYIYTTEGLSKALGLYPNASEFIELNADESYDTVKEQLLKKINRIDTDE